jgi:hypothetical protein
MPLTARKLTHSFLPRAFSDLSELSTYACARTASSMTCGCTYVLVATHGEGGGDGGGGGEGGGGDGGGGGVMVGAAVVGDTVVGETVVGDTVVGETVVGEMVGDTVGDTVVGEAVGDTVGEVVGDTVGDTVVGDTVGETVVGGSVGETVVGETVGDIEDGEMVGDTVGDTVVGETVGDTVVTVGEVVGDNVVGEVVGDAVGADVGLTVGQVEPKAVSVVVYVRPLLRLTTVPHSPALSVIELHRRTQQPSVQSKSTPSQRPGWAAGKRSLGCGSSTTRAPSSPMPQLYTPLQDDESTCTALRQSTLSQRPSSPDSVYSAPTAR